ncbi:hypothetical protein E2A64_10420 [Pseudohoeflea suaedae]|uniref:Uncharacterized protein n=1 Tax=Pseudohoeflea suaedae TaxID=877384 RepID=A0A4R5PJB4_9HYPH|nr:hypothetical protein [Pseudohoeflea suaedae]TDH35740.1 hypothetical protein E2A64_10420 [Pseudohoeflea suaedae]
MEYVIAESVPKPARGYITPSKKYELSNADDIGGEITDDEGDKLVILFQSCPHLNGGNWIRVTECDEPALIAGMGAHGLPPSGFLAGLTAEQQSAALAYDGPECDAALATETFGDLDDYIRKGDFIQTYTGLKAWPMDLRPEEVCIEDIAHSLAMQCRYAGHCQKFYCPTPEQRILTEDLRWVPAGDLREGDGLLAFDEEPVRIGAFGKNRRRMKHAVVKTAMPVKRRVIRLVMSDGSEVCSSFEHPWLVATKSSGNQKWVTAGRISEDIKLGRKRYIHKFFSPWEERTSKESGWLAGVYDGEGHLSIVNRRGTQLGVAQKPGVVLSKIEELLKEYEYSNYRYTQTGAKGSGVITLQTQGGFRQIAAMLGSIRPLRLLGKFTDGLVSGEFDKQMQSDGNPLEIVSARDEGVQWVAGIETSSKTYFCEGFGAHNSVAEHSVLMARYLAARGGNGPALAALMHDAAEAYLVDIPRPVKHSLPQYRELEDRVLAVINAKYGIGHYTSVKDADNRIIADEIAQNMTPMDWHGGHYEPLGVTLRFWTPEEAEREFLIAFREFGGVA